MKKLILVAARGEAKVFEKDGGKPLKWIKTLTNKKGRKRESEFHFDLPGRSFSKFKGASGPHRLEGKNSHTTTVAQKFAHAIANTIQDGCDNLGYDKAVVFASPRFISVIKKETKALAKRVPFEYIAKNIEKACTAQILEHI